MQEQLGSLVIDLQGTTLSQEECELLSHPLVGGVVLFARNYEHYQQLQDLCLSIQKIKSSLLILIDQEGGRVQRLRQGFTRLPPLASLGKLYLQNKAKAALTAKECGWLMATELLEVGISNSLAPVLDLFHVDSQVIGDRAFSEDVTCVMELAKAYISGMHEAGMTAVGKHFPGHGQVVTDSHVAMPQDARDLNQLESHDLKPFLASIDGGIRAIMVAHIVFSVIDNYPPTYSAIWLQRILRDKYRFTGLIISDDLNMEGANISNNFQDRFEQARSAGCDVVLLCNNRNGAIQILDRVKTKQHLLSKAKWQLLAKSDQKPAGAKAFRHGERHNLAKRLVQNLFNLTSR